MWETLVIEPMVNALLLLYAFLGNNFVVALAVFTFSIRLVMLPLSLKQQRSTMKMQAMQPQIQAIQKKYRDNPQRMQEEFQKIGYNPAESLMGCLPLLIQFPIFIGLYRAIFVMLGSTPQSVFEFTEQVYASVAATINLPAILPISNTFLWLNMAQPDPLFILPVLVAGTMFLQQKLTMPAAKKDDDKNKKGKQDDNPMASMTQSMTYTMPLMFGVFSLSFPAGLSIYFVFSNLVGIVQGVIIRRQREGLADTIVAPPQLDFEDDEPETSVKAKKNGRSAKKPAPERTTKKRTYSKRKRRSARR